MTKIVLLPTALADMFVEVTSTGRLSYADRYGMLAALLDASVGDDDRRSIDRILYALRRGTVCVVDDLSMIG